MVHAETANAIEVLVAEALAAGNTAPIYHALSRPPELEGEATNRAIQLARIAGAPLYVVHVSCAESVEPLALAREKGLERARRDVHAYFFIDETFLERRTSKARSTSTPPPAREGEPGGALERRTHRHPLGNLDQPLRHLFAGQKDARARTTRTDPNGGPGLENRLQMITTSVCATATSR